MRLSADYPFDTRMLKTDTLEAWEPDETIEKPQYDLPGILKSMVWAREVTCCICKFYGIWRIRKECWQ
ncbi:MAG: hypothetical protein ACLVJO_04435 [[Clostridium] scindens]